MRGEYTFWQLSLHAELMSYFSNGHKVTSHSGIVTLFKEKESFSLLWKIFYCVTTKLCMPHPASKQALSSWLDADNLAVCFQTWQRRPFWIAWWDCGKLPGTQACTETMTTQQKCAIIRLRTDLEWQVGRGQDELFTNCLPVYCTKMHDLSSRRQRKTSPPLISVDAVRRKQSVVHMA